MKAINERRKQKKQLLDFLNWLHSNEISIIPEQFIEIVDEFSKNINLKQLEQLNNIFNSFDVVICGSWALKWHQLLDREVGDIDVIVSDSTFKTLKNNFKNRILDKNINSSGIFYINGIEINSYYLKDVNLDIDIFVMNDQSYNSIYKNSIKISEAWSLKIDTIQHCIQAKNSYIRDNPIENSEKHIQDIKIIKEKMGF